MNDATPSDGVSRLDLRGGMASGRRWLGPVLAIPTPVIFVAAATLALGLLWRRGGLDEIGASVRAAHPAAILGILVVYAASILILGLRWHALVRMVDGTPGWTSSAEVFLTSVIINYAAPIGLAVPTRAALTVRDLAMSAGQSGSVVTWEAGLDIAALGTISALWLARGGLALVQTLTIDGRIVVVVGGVVVFGMVAVIAAARNKALRLRVGPFVERLLVSPARHPGLAMVAVGLTVVFWVAQIGVMAALLGIFAVQPRPTLVLGIMGLPVLIGMLSPVPGGAGVREALMAAVARLDGTPAGPVLLAAVAYRLALFAVTPIVWGAIRLARVRAGRG